MVSSRTVDTGRGSYVQKLTPRAREGLGRVKHRQKHQNGTCPVHGASGRVEGTRQKATVRGVVSIAFLFLAGFDTVVVGEEVRLEGVWWIEVKRVVL